MMGPNHEYKVNLHLHTTFSDGSGTIDEVIDAASKTLDVLMITDHDTLEGTDRGYERYHGDLLVIIGYEISGPHNHYLVFNSRNIPDYQWNDPQDFIDKVREDGGVGFIAHPFEVGSPMDEGGHAYTWQDWEVEGFTGLEIWNHSSAWKTKVQNWRTAFFYYFIRTNTLMGPDKPVLEKWDELGQTRRVPGVGGSDAHAAKIKKGPFEFCIFPYEFTFRSVTTHLLLDEPLSGDAEKDRQSVIKGLVEGSGYVSHDLLHSPDGFRFILENGNKFRAGQGGEIFQQSGDKLRWQLPVRAPHRLIKDGKVILEKDSDQGLVDVPEPGVYRLEAFIRKPFFGPRPWIYSNPIYIRHQG